jgi:carbonic anhydrase
MLTGRRWKKFVPAVVAFAVFLGGGIYWHSERSGRPPAKPAPADPGTALAELRSGNARFVNCARTLSTDTARDAEGRHRTAHKQHPFAVILSCSDSRICPEFVFDQRVGTIFEIRNAGNVVDDDVLASFEYAVEHLHVPLMLVMGHKGCGAIEAICEAGEKPLPDHLLELQKHTKAIRQQVVDNHDNQTPDLVNRLCKENARQQALALLRDSRVLTTAVGKGEVRLMCGIYDMDTGSVEFFDPR